MSRAGLPLELVAVSVARDFVGIEEDPSNRGPAVEYFQRAANLPPGSPWCAAFVNAIIEHACAIKDVTSPFESGIREGFVKDYVDLATDRGWLIAGDRAAPGDLFALWSSDLRRYAHIGLVANVAPGQARFWTVEGNTNEVGGREGVRVAERVRSLLDPNLVFIRWVTS